MIRNQAVHKYVIAYQVDLESNYKIVFEGDKALETIDNTDW